jgi:hypothetical protein
MKRKSVSLLVVLSLTVTLIALGAAPTQSADPTGLDNGNRVTSIAPISVKASEFAVEHWIGSYLIRLALRSLGL